MTTDKHTSRLAERRTWCVVGVRPGNGRRRLKYFRGLAALALVCGYVNAAQAQFVSDPELRVRSIAFISGGPFGPMTTQMDFIGPNDILVLQKNDGRVRRVTNGVVQAGSVLDLNVTSNGFFDERGLLGIALHPNFAANGFVYLYYTRSATGNDNTASPLDNRVERFTWNGSALTNPALIVSLPVTPVDYHLGGIIRFGPDGKLYIVIGDLERNGQLQNNSAGAPDDSGVILRLNDDGTIPTDNPFFAQGGNLAKYYAYGIRNSFGMAFDPVTGRLWDTENGLDDYDEINLVLPGFNSGWRQLQGPDARDPQSTASLFVVPGSHYADPKFSWLNVVAPTGLVFLSSFQLGPAYRNNLFVGDFNTGRLYRFRLNGSRDGFSFQGAGLQDLVADNNTELNEVVFGNFSLPISDLKVGPDGKLYVLTLDGLIHVIERMLSRPCPLDFDGDCKSDVGIFRDGTWSILRSFDNGATVVGLGGPGWTPVPADYDGDGLADVAAYLNGTWVILRSSDGQTVVAGAGGPSFLPVPADYDGDGKADIAVYSNGVWSILRSSDGVNEVVAHGGPGWIPVPADYDGDRKTDVAVYLNGAWSIIRSSDGGNDVVGHGGPVWTPVPADYDGDGLADVAVYTGGAWSIIRSSDAQNDVVGHGGPTWEPVAADYDGDGKTDIAVHTGGAWSIIQSSNSTITVVGHGGGPTDVPLN